MPYTAPRASTYYRTANRRAMPRSNLANYQTAARSRTAQMARKNYNGPVSHYARYGGVSKTGGRGATYRGSSGNVYKAANWRKPAPANWREIANDNYFNDRLMQRLGGDERAYDMILERRGWTETMQDEFMKRSEGVTNACVRKAIAAGVMQAETQKYLGMWQDGTYNPSTPRGTPPQPPTHAYRPLTFAWAPQLPSPPPPLWPVPDAEPGIRGQEFGYW